MKDVSMTLGESIVDEKEGENRNSKLLDEYAPSQAVKPITFMVDKPQPK